LIFFHPKGARVRKIIEDWMRDQYLARGYDLVYTRTSCGRICGGLPATLATTPRTCLPAWSSTTPNIG